MENWTIKQKVDFLLPAMPTWSIMFNGNIYDSLTKKIFICCSLCDKHLWTTQMNSCCNQCIEKKK